MALFKIFKGSSDKLYTSEKTKNLVEGYCYFTVDEGKFYIDIASEGDIYEKRICLNAAQADQLREKRTITLTGDAAGAFQFDGSEDVSVEITIAELDEINTAVSGKAPKSHASTGTTYGKGTSSKYGHVKLSDSIDSETAAASGGVAATPLAVKTAYDLANTANTQANTNLTNITQLQEDVKEISTKAPINHASSETTYGAGSSSNYGHLKLSSAINSSLNTDSGTAATPLAVKTAYDLANTANTTANTASTKATSNEGKITELTTSVNSLDSNKAPKSHASTATTYGAGTSSNYGHVKLSDSVASEAAAASGGTAATPKAVKDAYDLADSANTQANTNKSDIVKLKEDVEEIGTKANIKHDSTTEDFGKGTTSNFGHVKLSDSTNSETAAASGGTAATPKAVKDAYDLANTANTTANTNSGKITTLQSTVNDTLIPTVNSHSTKLQYTNVTYGTCSTAAATPAKVVTVDTNSKWELKKGSSITVLFSNTNTASNPTLNVNSTGAKNIYYGANRITTSNLSYAGYANRPMTFIYDGTQYRFASWGYDGNTNTYVTQTESTSSSSFPILLKNSANSTTETKGANFSAGVTITPSTNTLTATTFSGDLSGKATTADTADKVANSLTIKGNNTTAGTYNGSAATSVNIVGAGSTTVSGANGTITITGATIPTKLPNEHSLTIGSVEYDGSASATVESLRNPYSLTIQGNGTTLTNGTYNGSAAKTVNITPASIGALAANGTAVKATADASGNTITTTYETKSNVTTKISEALDTAKDYTDTSVASLINGAPEHLNTLKELADVLGTDANMSTTIIAMIGGKADAVHTHKDSEITKSSNWTASKITGNTLDAMLGSIDTHMGDAVSHIQDTTAHITAEERTKWNNAEANQNAFSKIKVGTTTIEADSVTDTVTFSGTNISITPTASSDTIAFKVASASTSTAGIVQLEDSRSSTSTTTAATPNSVKAAYDLASEKAPISHAVNANTYGLGTSELYGHVKLSDGIDDGNDTTTGIAATPKAASIAAQSVEQYNSNTGGYRPLLMHYSYTANPGEDVNTATGRVYYNAKISASPETGNIFATTFTGNLIGIADYANALSNTVTINGTTFQNAGDSITTKNWGVARSINIVNSDGTEGPEAISIGGNDNKTAYSLKLPTTIKASLIGNVTGNADTATKATQDGNGNTISSTYLKLSGGTMSGNIKIGQTGKGYFLMDKTGYNYPGIYDNGSNLWIGSTATASQHHTGSTYISTGHNGTTGNESAFICIPNDANDGGTNHAILHEGNYSKHALPLSGGKMTGAITSTYPSMFFQHAGYTKGTAPTTAPQGYISWTDKNGTSSKYRTAMLYNTVTTDNISKLAMYAYKPQSDVSTSANIYVQYGADGTSKAGSTAKFYGAVWNDYAEFRKYKDGDQIPYGRVVIENGDDSLSLSTERMQKGGNLCSDTFGFAIGETEETQMPIAVSGRALAYTNEDRNSYEPGDAVCTGPNGTISKMTREEIKEYPDCIIGYVSAIPEYETWGETNIPVDGRIWIKVV